MSIATIKEQAAQAVQHPLMPKSAAAAIMGLVELVGQQQAAIQELRELVRPCPCSERAVERMAAGMPAMPPGEKPLPTITDVFGVGLSG